MSSKPESTFSRSIHKYLPPEVYYEKMHNPFRGGTFDFWYSGVKDMWVEYKFIQLPKKPETLILPALSQLQIVWATERSQEGRNLAVIVGCKDGGVVFRDHAWLTPISTQKFQENIMSRKDLAIWLTHQMGRRP